MNDNETIDDMITRFAKITNGLFSLGDSIDNNQKVTKVICALPQSWEVKSTNLKELNDKEEIDFMGFIGNLKTHKMERKLEKTKCYQRRRMLHPNLLLFFRTTMKTLTMKKIIMKSSPS